MVMEEMTLDQIALAAECVTLARVEFARATFLAPLESVLEGVAGVKVSGTQPQTEADRAAGRKRSPKKKAPKKKRTAEDRDAAIFAMAQHLGYPIETEKG